MTPLEELAAKLRTFWLRDIGASSSSTDTSAAADGSVSLGRTFFIPAAGGLVGINQIPTDPYALDVSGHARIAGNLYARAGNSWNMGADGTPWGAIYASELHVGNLIAENKLATTGGRILVSPSTKVILAVTTGATTIDVAANTLTSGDRIYLESTGKLEWMAVTSGATAVTGGYRYSVTRNLNGAGAQTWSAGDAVVNTGQTGQGFIDLYSRYGIPANGQTSTTRLGPTIVGNVRTGATFDAIKERWAVGNLKGLYDYAATAYGLAAGDPAAAWISVDATNGIRLVNNATVLGQWTAAGAITIGEVAAGKSNVAISSGQLDVRSNATNRISLTSAGILTIRNSSGNAVFTFDSSAGAEFTLPLTLATTGGIYQGTGTFASPTTGLKIYNSGGIGLIAGYNTGTAQWYADTDGKLYAGGGGVTLSAAGILLGDNGTKSGAKIAWDFGSGETASIVMASTGGTDYLTLKAVSLGYPPYGAIRLSGYVVYIRNDGNTAPGTLHMWKAQFAGATSGTATITPPAVAGTPTLTLPTSTGTLALTSDITAAVVGTSGMIAKFTGTNAVGNSILSESGAALSAAGTFTIIGQSDTNQLVVKGHSTQTSGQILIQTSAAAELARIYVSASNAIAIGYQAGASLSSSTGSVMIGYQAGNALTSNPSGPFIGYQAGKLSTAIDNLAIGNGALAAQTTGAGNTAIGHNALAALNSSGSANLAIGDHSSEAMTSGQYNVSIGSSALAACLSGQNNVAIGAAALFACTGSGNISVGAWSAYYLTTGGDNMFFGYAAAMSCNGSRNVAMGSEAGRTSSVSTFSDSIYIGYRSGYNGTAAGSNNVAIGSETLQKNVSNAVAIGFNAGKVQTGAGFTAIGYQAGLLSTSGTNSTLIGSGAGASLTTNGGCVMIGYQAGNAETAANKLYIANSSTTTPLIYGDFSTPSLTFNGTVNIADAKNIVFGTTTGTKLGATTSDKLAFWGATPIVQPTTGVAAATFTANAGTAVNDASTFDGYTIKQVVKALRNMGALA